MRMECVIKYVPSAWHIGASGARCICHRPQWAPLISDFVKLGASLALETSPASRHYGYPPLVNGPATCPSSRVHLVWHPSSPSATLQRRHHSPLAACRLENHARFITHPTHSLGIPINNRNEKNYKPPRVERRKQRKFFQNTHPFISPRDRARSAPHVWCRQPRTAP